MSDFTASNGVTLRVGSDGFLLGRHASVETDREVLHATASPDLGMTALREFFRAEEDERLGRWRWPENPDYVVYDLGRDLDGFRFAQAMYEPTGNSGRWQEGQKSIPVPTQPEHLGILAVSAYFAAHPEPKPWHEAKPGEAWVIDIGDEEYPNTQAVVVSNEGRFLYRDGGSVLPGADYIRSGHRVWPEVSS